MLAALGLLTIVVLLAVIISKKMTPLLALIAVPMVAALIGRESHHRFVELPKKYCPSLSRETGALQQSLAKSSGFCTPTPESTLTIQVGRSRAQDAPSRGT